MLTCISTAQARTQCGSRFWDPAGPRHCFCKFPYNVPVVKCWLAFRLRRLAQSLCLRSGLILACSILPANFRIKCFLWHVGMHFDCAGSHKVCVLSCRVLSCLVLSCLCFAQYHLPRRFFLEFVVCCEQTSHEPFFDSTRTNQVTE